MYSAISPLVQLTVYWIQHFTGLGKELQQIANELIEEFSELTKLPSINFAIQKSKELYAKVSDILLYWMMCAVCSCFWLEVYDM